MQVIEDLAQANELLSMLDGRIRELEGEVTKRNSEVARLRAELMLLRQGIFGRKREAFDPNQARMFEDGAEQQPEVEREEVELPARKVTRKKKQGHGRGTFPPDLPRETIQVDVPESDRCCNDCGEPMRQIGEEVTERGHIVPVRMVVKRYVRPKYACPKGHGIKTGRLPDGVIDGGKYEASVYSHVVVSKYCDHLPLHRLEGIFRRYGFHLPKQSMWDMLVRTDELAVQPLLRQMHEELLAESILHADESPVTLRVEGEKTTRTGYVWLWRNVRNRGQPKVVVDFRDSRSSHGPLRFLSKWSGTLLTDGYSGYDAVTKRNGITRAGCWVHARRKFKNAYDTGSKTSLKLLRKIQRLFWIERAVVARAKRDMFADDDSRFLELRQRVRARRSRRVVEGIFRSAAAAEKLRDSLPKSELGKALTYLANQRRALEVFLDEPRLPIHNNDAERDLRHIVTGRKNWYVFGSQRGGEVAGRLYSLVLSCKQNGVDPESYLTDILERISTTPHSQIASLTPWAWARRRDEAQG